MEKANVRRFRQEDNIDAYQSSIARNWARLSWVREEKYEQTRAINNECPNRYVIAAVISHYSIAPAVPQ